MYFFQQDFDKALQAFEKVISKNPRESKALNNLGVIYKNKNKPEEALKYFDQAIQIEEEENKQNPDAYINKGSVLDDLKKFDEAIEQYDKAIAIDANKPDVYNNKAIALKHRYARDKNEQDLADAKAALEKCVQLDEKYILAYSNLAQLELQLQNQPQALAYMKKTQELLKDNAATKSLSENNKKFIGNTIESAIKLEVEFGKKAEELKKQMEKDFEKLNEEQREEYRKKFQEIEEKKNQIQAMKIDKMQKAEQQDSKQSKKEDEEGEKMLKAQMEQMKEFMKEQMKMIAKLEEDNKKIKKENEKIKEKVEEHETVLQAAGVYDQATIKVWFDKNKETQRYIYAKAFYWTLFNYFDAYRVASTGVLKNNEAHAETFSDKTKKEKLAKNIAGTVAKVASNIPIIGGFFKLIDKAIDGLYEARRKTTYEHRVNAITKIIVQNKHFQTAEDLSMALAKAAQNIADGKQEVLEQKEFELHQIPDPSTQSIFSRAKNYLKQKVEEIKEAALGQKVEVYKDAAGQEALYDVIIVLAYMDDNYDAVIQSEDRFEVTIFNCVTKDIQKKVLENSNPDDKTRIN